MNLIRKVKETIFKHKMFQRGETVIVAVSGGPDSVCLLFILNRLRHELGINLHIAHLNHGLRKSAVADQRFVEKLAKQFILPCATAAVRIQKSKNKGSIEEMARERRFDFLMRTAKRCHANTIALGHTQDDLAETVLMRILRGAGLSGIRGIIPKREIRGFVFVRPLIDVSRSEIETFLKKERLRFRLDPTNRQTRFLRNKIRLKLLPYLQEKYNTDIKKILSHLSHNATTDYEYLEDRATHIYKSLRKKSEKKHEIRIPLNKIRKLHPSLKRMLIRLGIGELKGDTRRLTFAHINEIEKLLGDRPVGSVVHLPSRIRVSKQEKNLSITLRNS